MFRARQGKEIVIRTSNQVGALKHIAKIVAEKGVEILAIDCHVYDLTAVFRLMTDDNLRAVDALRARKFDPSEVDVVVAEIPHTPGMLKQMTERLEDADLDLRHLYATSPVTGGKCLVVFSSSDNAKALVELNKETKRGAPIPVS